MFTEIEQNWWMCYFLRTNIAWGRLVRLIIFQSSQRISDKPHQIIFWKLFLFPFRLLLELYASRPQTGNDSDFGKLPFFSNKSFFECCKCFSFWVLLVFPNLLFFHFQFLINYNVMVSTSENFHFLNLKELAIFHDSVARSSNFTNKIRFSNNRNGTFRPD